MRLCIVCEKEMLNPHGKRKYHKECSKEHKRTLGITWRKNNKERKRLMDKVYKEKNKEKLEKKRIEYYSNPINILKKNTYMVEYHKRPEVILRRSSYMKIYSKKLDSTEEGRLKHNQRTRKRRLKLRLVKEVFTIEQWTLKVESMEGICPLCNKRCKLTIDHIVPVSKAPIGFVYTINDVQPICYKCNLKKGNK